MSLQIYSLHPDEPLGWDEVRRLRNECSPYFTGDAEFVSSNAQQRFRSTFDVQRQMIYLLADEDAIGFLYLRYEEGGWWPTYGVTKSRRGQGYGRFLVQLSQVLVSDLWLRVNSTNKSAVKLYMKSGFVTHSADEGIITMKWSRPHDPVV